MAITAVGQDVGETFYIYRNDGGFNAFFREDVDSIVYSNYDNDSTLYEDVVTQVIYTSDSIYRIPLAAIDSVGFVTPETVYRQGVRVIDELADYVISSDSLNISLSNNTPLTLVPKVGEKIITSEISNGFPSGFAGKVKSIIENDECITIYCDAVGISDIYEVYYGITKNLVYTENGVSRKVKKDEGDGSVKIQPGSKDLDLSDFITIQNKLTEELAFRFTPELLFLIEPKWQIKGFIIYTPETDLYASAVCTADYFMEERLGGEATIQWQKDFKIPIPPPFRKFPIIAPWFNFYWDIGFFVRFDFTLAARFKWNQHYRQVMVYEYCKKSEESLNKNTKGTRLISSSHNEEGLMNGTSAIGGFVEAGFEVIDDMIAKLNVRGEIGLEATAQAVLFKRDFENASRSTALYEQMRDSGFALNWFWDVSIEEAIGPWSVEVPVPLLHGKNELWRLSYLPKFSDVWAGRDTKKTRINSNMTASGKCLTDVEVGITLIDDDDNQTTSSFATYTGTTKKYNCEFNNVVPTKTYTMYPTIKAWEYTILATPCVEVEEALEVTTVNASNIKTSSAVLEGQLSGFEKKTSTGEVGFYYYTSENKDNPKYVYRGDVKYLPDDGKFERKISGLEPQTRYYYYAVYKGEDILYGETKSFKTLGGENLCPDGDHPHLIDLGLPSGTLWSCKNIGADAPDDNGGYYAWGETTTKETYNAETYGHYDKKNFEYVDIGTNISGTSYDVAKSSWKAPWQMPTSKEIEELCKNCDKKLYTLNGAKGILFEGKNGNVIFFPFAGDMHNGGLYGENEYGYYWSDTQTAEYNFGAYNLFITDKGTATCNYGQRHLGRTVRPVCKKKQNNSQ